MLFWQEVVKPSRLRVRVDVDIRTNVICRVIKRTSVARTLRSAAHFVPTRPNAKARFKRIPQWNTTTSLLKKWFCVIILSLNNVHDWINTNVNNPLELLFLYYRRYAMNGTLMRVFIQFNIPRSWIAIFSTNIL